MVNFSKTKKKKKKKNFSTSHHRVVKQSSQRWDEIAPNNQLAGRFRTSRNVAQYPTHFLQDVYVLSSQ
jgi:hypothetical protein